MPEDRMPQIGGGKDARTAHIPRRQLRLPLEQCGEHRRIDVRGGRHEQAAAGRQVGAQPVPGPAIKAVRRQQRDH